jgi:DNA-binding transcriptional LysR family regulator
VNIKQLEALIYVSRHGTFKQAAEQLYFETAGEEFITPESIQYRIKQLEQAVGVSLYRKRQGSARVLLTREGQLFLREAIEVYQRMAEWRGLFLDGDRGTLTFATTQAVMIHRLVDPVRQYRARHPGVRLRVLNATAQEMEHLVAEGRIDFSLSTRAPENPDLEYTPWKHSRMAVLVPRGHKLARRRGVTLAEVAEHPLVLLEPELKGDRELVDDALRRAGVARPNIVVETSNSEIIAALVESGVGISIVAETVMLRQQRDVACVPLADPIGDTEVGLLVRSGQYLPFRARAFLTELDPFFETCLADKGGAQAGGNETDGAPSPSTGRKQRSRT